MVGFYTNGYAQDHITMLPYTNSLGINPAFAGIMAEKLALRVGFAPQPLLTTEEFSATGPQLITIQHLFSSLSAPIQAKQFSGGAGLHVETMQIGGYRASVLQGLLAYQAPIQSRYTFLRAGLSLGAIQRNISQDNYLVFEDQFRKRDLGFDSGLYSVDRINFNGTLNVWAPDVSLGILFYKTQKIKGNPEFNPFVGVSVQHINQPSIGFLNRNSASLGMRWTGQLGFKQRFRTPWDINLALLGGVQNQTTTLRMQIAGRYALYKNNDIFDDELLALTAGLVTGTHGNLSPYFVCELKNKLSLALAFNFALAPANFLNSPYGGFQLSMQYIFAQNSSNRNTLPFPTF